MTNNIPMDKVTLAISTVCKNCNNKNCLLSKVGKTRSFTGIAIFVSKNTGQVLKKVVRCNQARHQIDYLSGDTYLI